MSEHTLKPFVTGSHAYGTPTAESDMDLVVFVTPEEMDAISRTADEDASYDAPGYYALGCRSYRFGRLDLLCCTEEKVYRAWWEGTRALKKMRLVSREYACRMMKAVREAAGIGIHATEAPAHRGPAEDDIPF